MHYTAKANHLSQKLFEKDIEQVPTRNGFGEGLVAAGKKDKRIVALCADLTESTRMEAFKKAFPDRFIEVGVAEQALATIASGMANYGKIPFIASYAAFSPGRNYEQIRTTIALNDVPVKIVGSHAGISVGEDGATHQMLEDIAIMRALPNMTVVVPCDAQEATKATLAIAITAKPAYIRLTREKSPVLTTSRSPFKMGKAQIFWQSKRPCVAIIGCGPLLYEALLAAQVLEKKKIGCIVLNCHTIKPLDRKTILAVAKQVKGIVSVEEHQVIGGLGSAIAETLAAECPTPMRFVGIQDHFGESGKPAELMKKFRLTSKDIVKAAKEIVSQR